MLGAGYHPASSNGDTCTYARDADKAGLLLILAENGYLSLVLFVAFYSLCLIMNLRAAWTFRTDLIGGFSIGLFAGCGMIYLQSIL